MPTFHVEKPSDPRFMATWGVSNNTMCVFSFSPRHRNATSIQLIVIGNPAYCHQAAALEYEQELVGHNPAARGADIESKDDDTTFHGDDHKLEHNGNASNAILDKLTASKQQ